jgi:hypothetical protein
VLPLALFGSTLFTLDYAGRRVIFETGFLDRDDPETLDYYTSNGAPYVRIPVGDSELHFLIDTGAQVGLGVDARRQSDLHVVAGPRDGHVFAALGGYSRERLVRVEDTFRLGRHEIPSPCVAWRNGGSVPGHDVLRHFRVTFDRATHRILLRREGNEPLTLPSPRTCGMALGTHAETGVLVVFDVVPGTAADRAGLRRGDRIVLIDGEPPGDPSLVAWQARQDASDEIRVRVERDGSVRDVVLAIEPLLP